MWFRVEQVEEIKRALRLPDPETAKLVHAGSLESMTYSGTDLAEFLRNKDAVVIGPGLAASREIVGSIDVPLVIGASVATLLPIFTLNTLIK